MLRLVVMIGLFVFAIWTAASVIGCTPADDSTTCARAKTMLGECGVMLPLLDDGQCTGSAEEISKCIETTNGSCDALADLGKHLDRCMTTDGGAIPDDFPALDAKDAGHDAAVIGPSDDDAGAPPIVTSVDAGTDSGTLPNNGIFDVSGTIASGETQSFQTSRLSAGTYTFSFVSTGTIDVYLRKGFAPTTTTYDCTTSAPATSCAETIASSAILYVLVVGESSSSNFSIDAKP